MSPEELPLQAAAVQRAVLAFPVVLLYLQRGFYVKASVGSCLHCISPSPHLKACRTGNESKVIKRGFKGDNTAKLQIAHKSLSKTFLEIMQTAAQLCTQHSCYPQTRHLCPRSSLHQLLTPQPFLHFSSCHRNLSVPAAGEGPAKQSLWHKRLKDQGTHWTVPALDQAHPPEQSQHCQSTSAPPETPPWQGTNTPLTCQVSQLQFSAPLCFLLLPSADGSEGKEKKKDYQRTSHNHLSQNPSHVYYKCPEQKSQGNGVFLLSFLQNSDQAHSKAPPKI